MLTSGGVYILTTEGPVLIQRIAEEDAAVRSVICLDGRAQSLPISAAYDAFVRRPTGVIERLTGHPAYRMDVSARVDDGRSWQLAALLAHLLRLQGMADGLCIFATGEIDSRLHVRNVEQVPRKLDALAAALPTLAVEPTRAVILVPATDERLPERIGNIVVHPVTTIDDALGRTGMRMPKAAKMPVEWQPWRNPLVRLGASALIVAALMFWFSIDLVRWAGLSQQGRLLELEEQLSLAAQSTGSAARAAIFTKWLKARAPDGESLIFDGQLTLGRTPGNCARGDTLETVALTPAYEGGQPVCGIAVRSMSDAAALVGRLAYWPDGLGVGERPARVMRGSAAPSGRLWSLTFKDLPQPGAVVRLIAIAGATEVTGTQPWYTDLLSAPIDSSVYAAAVQRVERLGYHVAVQEWRWK